MSLFAFYLQMPTLARQELAEFFFVLILLLLFDTKEISPFNRKILLVLFSFSLIVSHYGLTYLFIIYLIIFSLAMHILFRSIKIPVERQFILLLVIATFFWYNSTASGTLLDIIILMFSNIYSNIQRDLFCNNGSYTNRVSSSLYY